MPNTDINFIIQRLQDDGLLSILPILRETSSLIAGSYVVPFDEAENLHDIDIWIPFGPDQQSVVGQWVGCFYQLGFGVPHVILPTQGRSTIYTRFHTIVSSMLSYKKDAKRRIQLLVLTEQGGQNGHEIIRDFDICLVQRFFDGVKLYSTDVATLCVSNNYLLLNIDSDVIRNQSLQEWVRTIRRLKKYKGRGFAIHENVSTCLYEIISVITQEQNKHFSILLNTIDQWNKVAHVLRLPVFAPCILCPGETVKDVCLLLTKPTNDEIYTWYTIPDKAIKIDIAFNDKTNRILKWKNKNHLISTICPFPSVEQVHTYYGASTIKVLMEQTIYDHVTLCEYTMNEFIETGGLVLYVSNVPHAFHRKQLELAPKFTPCVMSGTAQTTMFDVYQSIVYRISISSGNFYVPMTQMDEIMNLVGYSIIELIPSGIQWSNSKLFYTNGREIEGYVGGPVNNGGVGTSKYIHFIRRVKVHC